MSTQVTWLAIAALLSLSTSGCSLLLDFDRTTADAGPTGVDAFAIDPEAAQALEPNDDFESAIEIIGGDQNLNQGDANSDSRIRLHGSDQSLIANGETINNRINRGDADALDGGK